MRYFLVALTLALGLALSGCSVFTKPGEIPVSEKLSAPAQVAQTAINEANVLLAAVAKVIAQNAKDGISTKEEAQKLLDKVRKYSADVDKAKKLLDAGDIMSAKTQAELVNKLIVSLHREVTARARKQ